jgi:hypothetical protein
MFPAPNASVGRTKQKKRSSPIKNDEKGLRVAMVDG